jgi:hypothetical protein
MVNDEDRTCRHNAFVSSLSDNDLPVWQIPFWIADGTGLAYWVEAIFAFVAWTYPYERRTVATRTLLGAVIPVIILAYRTFIHRSRPLID